MIEQFTTYIIRICVAKRCRKLWIEKSFATGKTTSDYTNQGNENCIRKIDFKGKVQERRIKDYVKRLLKSLSDFFSGNSKSSLNTILLDISFLTPIAKKTPIRV